jgi:hypothetical protein
MERARSCDPLELNVGSLRVRCRSRALGLFRRRRQQLAKVGPVFQCKKLWQIVRQFSAKLLPIWMFCGQFFHDADGAPQFGARAGFAQRDLKTGNRRVAFGQHPSARHLVSRPLLALAQQREHGAVPLEDGLELASPARGQRVGVVRSATGHELPQLVRGQKGLAGKGVGFVPLFRQAGVEPCQQPDD